MKTGSESTKITAIDYPFRKSVDLIIGNEYYFSMDGRRVRKCRLLEVREINGDTFIAISTRTGLFRFYNLYADEVGLTPRQAKEHMVTF